MTEYHHWINRLADHLFSHSSLWGKISMVNLATCLFSLFWSTIFSGLHFYTLPKTLIACRAMQLRFFKVKTLLNDAFKVMICLGVHRRFSISIIMSWEQLSPEQMWYNHFESEHEFYKRKPKSTCHGTFNCKFYAKYFHKSVEIWTATDKK